MTIRKRLAISNILMIFVPVAVTLFIAACCVGIIWLYIAYGSGLGFQDSQEFIDASSTITELASDALEHKKDKDRKIALEALSSFLDKRAMSILILNSDQEYYSHGNVIDEHSFKKLEDAAWSLGNNCIITTGRYNLCANTVEKNGNNYIIFLYNLQTELSYVTLKKIIIITSCVIILSIIISIVVTDRFLTGFIFNHIKSPLDILGCGVKEISNGNLEYHVEYNNEDEFTPICTTFNDMARYLKESVEKSRHEEESRKELMASISHDLRSPLTSIQAYVEGLLDGVASTPEAQNKYLLTIKARSEELEKMVEHVLSFSKIDIATPMQNLKEIRLDEFLKDEVQICFNDYKGRGLIITTELEACTIKADVSELKQIFMNIADNSLKYKTKENANLKISLKESLSNSQDFEDIIKASIPKNEIEQNWCELSFTDDGPGVPINVLPKIFDLFYRENSSRNDRTKGSGIGLAIVEKAVHKMGGIVRAKNVTLYNDENKLGQKNNENGGLSIIISLPIYNAKPKMQNQEISKTSRVSHFRRTKIGVKNVKDSNN